MAVPNCFATFAGRKHVEPGRNEKKEVTMLMTKRTLTALALMATTMAARAADYDYLTLLTADGYHRRRTDDADTG